MAGWSFGWSLVLSGKMKLYMNDSDAHNQQARRRPGRPSPNLVEKDQTRLAILDTAELLFASAGYAAISFREIGNAARVNPALISYYFGTKRALFEAVYLRRGKELTDRWTELLDELEARPNKPPTVEELLWAFTAPAFEMRQKGPGGMAFIQLQARVHSECDEESFQLRRNVYDQVAKRFLAALEGALPHMDPAEISWRFMFVIGVVTYMSSGVDRLVDVSGGRFDSQRESQEAVPRIMSFCVAGFTGPVTSTLRIKRSERVASKRGPESDVPVTSRAKQAGSRRR